MARIRSRDTGPELMLRRGLWAAGTRGWRCHRNLPGKPDLAFGPARIAVFVDGAFWHGHPDHFTSGKSGRYWDEKIMRNQKRDSKANTELAASGWTVLRFWDFEVEDDLDACVREIVEAIEAVGSGERPGSRLNEADKTLGAH